MQMIKIMLAAGHGGADRYNVGPTGYVEADGTLRLAIEMKRQLDTWGIFDTQLARDTDCTMSLTEKGMTAKGMDVYFSLHSNAYNNDPSVRGTEVYTSVDLPDDVQWAAIMSRKIADWFNVPDRGAKTNPGINDPTEDYFTEIDVAQDIGAKHVFLVESLFHSSPLDEAILKSEEGVQDIAGILIDVLLQMYPIETPDEPSSWAKEAWDWAYNSKLNDGTRLCDGTRPHDKVTREENVTMMYRKHLMDGGE